MAIELTSDQLARLCFRRVPNDVVDRDVVLAHIWGLLLEHAKRGLPITDRTVSHAHLGKRCGLRSADYRAALTSLKADGMISEAGSGYCLTPSGFAALRNVVDVGRGIAAARA